MEEGGLHAAEAVVLARDFMFTQVYFHKTRLTFDVHIQEALREILPSGAFPAPRPEEVRKFLEWDDWKVLGLIHSGEGGEHSKMLASRNHYRQVYETPEISTAEDMKKLERVVGALGETCARTVPASKSWYKTGDPDVQVRKDVLNPRAEPLSRHSAVVKNLARNNQVRVFSKPEDVPEARERIKSAVRQA